MNPELDRMEESIHRMQRRVDRLIELRAHTVNEIDQIQKEVQADMQSLKLQLNAFRYTDAGDKSPRKSE